MEKSKDEGEGCCFLYNPAGGLRDNTVEGMSEEDILIEGVEIMKGGRRIHRRVRSPDEMVDK